MLIALLIATSFKSAIADWYVVPTGSMNPTIVEGDRVFTNKLAYDLKLPYTTRHIAKWDNPKRGDIVIFNSPADGKRLVKRVVGIPGDRIALRNNQLFINDDPLRYEVLGGGSLDPAVSSRSLIEEFYMEDLAGHRHTMMTMPDQPSIRTFPTVIVPEEHYFMMGDNRDNSADSRYFGFVERTQILGRASAVIISLDLGRHYRPRWDRFFTRLQQCPNDCQSGITNYYLFFEAPCTKVQGIFQARKGFICCSSLANPRSKLRGMRSLFLFKNKDTTLFIG